MINLEAYGVSNFATFLLAGILLNITPGQDTMYILARSIGQGRYAGILAALGISTGAMVHTLAAACGLSVLLARSAIGFEAVKWCGAGYLIYQGIKILRQEATAAAGKIRGPIMSPRQMYYSGLLTNVLNPKVGLFFLAFLPQFVIPGQGSILSFLILGITFIITGTIWSLCLVLFASRVTEALSGQSLFPLWLGRISGCVFIGLGVNLLFTARL